MFTGIVETTGTVDRRSDRRPGTTFTVSAPVLKGRLSSGDSVAINGVCQTVESVSGEHFSFTAVGETLRRTTFDSMVTGAQVNLEVAATPETALGGHLVQGHVDGVGTVESFEEVGKDKLLTLRLPKEVGAYVVSKGSIAVDGVSLTIVETRPEDTITVTIIPFTIEKTIIKHYRRGTKVNVESDIVAKYVREYVSQICGERGC